MINTLRLYKKDGKKPSYQEAVSLTEHMAYFQEKTAQYQAVEAPVKSLLGEAYHGVESDWAAIADQMAQLQSLFSDHISFGKLKLLTASSFSAERANFSKYSEKLSGILSAYPAEFPQILANRFDRAIFDFSSANFQVIAQKCEDCLREFDKLENWYHFRNLLSKLEDQEAIAYLEAVIHRETYCDYTAQNISDLWRDREASEETARLLQENDLPNLARIFTERRYKAEDNLAISRSYFDFLKKQGFFNQ